MRKQLCFNMLLPSLLLVGGLALSAGIARAQSISGQARTELGDGIADATVTLVGTGGSFAQFTNSGGDFTFSGLTNGQTYSLCVSLDANPLNGVTSYDLSLLFQQILYTVPFNSPYKIIAGQTDPVLEAPDLGDLMRIRNLILGISADLPVPSWKFIPADHLFPDPAHPFSTPFPEGCQTVTVNGNTTGQDFIGVKTGDFNNNAVPN